MKTSSKKTMYKRLWALLIDGAIVSVLIALAVFIVLYFELSKVILYFCIPAVLLIYPNAFQFSHIAATPGMLVMGIYVTYNDNKSIHKSHLQRMFWSIVSWIPLGLGFWLGFFNRYGRTVYDIRSSSEVVSVDLSSVKKERPCAFVKQADGTVKTFFIESNRLVFGRNKETCDVVYPESKKSISRNHCSVSYNKQTEMFLLEDMDSSYGTFLSSGMRALPHKVYAINPNDKFYIVDKSNEIVLGFAGN